VHQRGIEQLDAQLLVARKRSGLVINPPARELPRGFLDLVALYRLRRLVEDLSVAQGTAQLDVFGMGPDQRAGGASGFAAEEFKAGQVVVIPDLFRKQAAGAGGASYKVA